VLFRSQFWVPQGAEGRDGAYVTFPLDALIAVTALESQRHRCLVVGEDLGTVPDGLRESLSRAGIFSYRVLWFEREGAHFRPPADYPARALACLASHDLPTFSGWRAGRDIDWRARLGRSADPAGERRARGQEVAALDAVIGGAAGEVEALHAFLGRSPCRLAALQAEDILGLEEQANLPGTIHEHPNWRRRLPVDAGAFAADPRLAAAAAIMKTCGRQGGEA